MAAPRCTVKVTACYISQRANLLKGDGTLEEHKRLVAWMESWPAQREVEAVEGGGTSYKVLSR